MHNCRHFEKLKTFKQNRKLHQRAAPCLSLSSSNKQQMCMSFRKYIADTSTECHRITLICTIASSLMRTTKDKSHQIETGWNSHDDIGRIILRRSWEASFLFQSTPHWWCNVSMICLRHDCLPVSVDFRLHEPTVMPSFRCNHSNSVTIVVEVSKMQSVLSFSPTSMM